MTMRRTREPFLERTIVSRAQVVELIAGAVVLAFGVNILSSRLVEAWTPGALWIGLACTLLPLAYLVWRFAGAARTRVEELSGFFVYDDDRNELVSVARYDYSEHLGKYVRALVAENPAFQRLWDEQPLRAMNELVYRGDAEGWKSAELISKATEYWVLNQLSLRLSEHFESRGFGEDANLQRIARSDIPDVLLENPFLKLFSEPMEERAAFASHLKQGDREVPGRVVYASGEGGAVFDFFELVVPKNTQVSRADPKTIRLDTSRFSFTFEVAFEGFSEVLPRGLERLYLPTDRDVSAYKIVLRTRTELKLRGLLTPRGWEYYRWLDAFVDELDVDFSGESFLDRIGWELALTTVAAHREADAADWQLRPY